MTAAATPAEPAPPQAPAAAQNRLVWWHELFFVGLYYGAYTLIRNQFGSASVGSARAYANARTIIAVERSLGIFDEASLQQHFVSLGWFMRFWNVFYGSLHFVVPIATLVWLFRRHPRDYPIWRNTLLIATGLALVGFTLFPLMPPRLLCDCPYGAGPGVDHGFVDTLAVHGGLWSFDSSTLKSLSNQYAAMPSLHFAWALWCFLALWPRLRHRWSRVLICLFPATTLFAIVVTANHYWLDAIAGAVVVGIAYPVGARLARFRASRTDARCPRGHAPSTAAPEVRAW